MEKLEKETKERIMEMIKKAGDPENYEISWNEKGIPISKKKDEVKKGKKSRAKGGKFELKVREDLENKEMIVDKWTNNVDLEKGEIIPAKKKFNPFHKAMMVSSGFPDFIAIKHVHDGLYRILGVEVKFNGILSKEEKEKCAWYLQKGVFSRIWVAKAVINRRKIEVKYNDFLETYGEKYNKT